MFEDADNIADLFRGGLPYYVLITLPILIICSSNPVLASNEFSVQRMAQFDVHGISYGCRASALNLEAKSLHTWSTSRHCIVTRFHDLTVDHFREIRAKAGGLIVLLPENLSNASAERRQEIYALEQTMLSQEITIPVYFSKYNEQLDAIIDDISASKSNDSEPQIQSAKRDSALAELISTVSANGYQVTVTGAHHNPNKQSKIPIIQGELVPALNKKNAGSATTPDARDYSKLPLIIVAAHLDNFGIVNDHLANIDAAVLLTLIDTFSKVHSSHGMAPKYRLLFLLSESGYLLNFQGAKKWIEQTVEGSATLQNAEFVVCLDSVGKSSIDDSIFMHVSKPPKEGTQTHAFYKKLKQNAQRYGNATVEGVHKKINLAEAQLAWEHERFSIKRMPAFTLSALKSHKDAQRTTIFETSREQTLAIAQRNSKIIAETLANYIYGGATESNDINAPSNIEIFSGSMAITSESIKPWLQLRSSQINNDLKSAFEKYLKNVKISYEKPDAREPDFMFYDGQDGTLNVYSVKPAVFDLFLTFVIVAYLSTVYFTILYFGHFYSAICRLSNSKKIKAN